MKLNFNKISFLNKRNETDSNIYKIEDLVIDPEFESIFPQTEININKIFNSYLDRGFDYTCPIICWKFDGHVIVIDGHTRIKACKKANIESVPVVFKMFTPNTRESVIKWIRDNQNKRRNLEKTELEISIFKQLVDYERQENKGKYSNEYLMQDLGIKETQLRKYREVLRNGSSEQIDRILNGKSSLNKIFNEIKNSQNPVKEKSEKSEKSEKKIFISFDKNSDSFSEEKKSVLKNLIESEKYFLKYLYAFSKESISDESQELLKTYCNNLHLLSDYEYVWNAMVKAISELENKGIPGNK